MKTLIALLCVLCLASSAGAQYFEYNPNMENNRRYDSELRADQDRIERRQREQQIEIDRLSRQEAERRAERNRSRDYPLGNAKCSGGRILC